MGMSVGCRSGAPWVRSIYNVRNISTYHSRFLVRAREMRVDEIV